MKRIICNKVYDTQTATLVKKTTFSYYGDPAGFEETLYQNEGGFYFLYTNGGYASQYTKENIKRISKERVKLWLATH